MNTTTTAQRMSVESLTISRAEQRKQRLLEIETELALEEAEALKMTEEQRLMLLQPFTAVKAEFDDLDGLRWTQTALRKLQPPHRRVSQVATPSPATAKHGTFVVLTNSDLATFSPEDTIRVSSSTKSRPTFPAPLVTTKHAISVTEVPCRHRDGSRSRSPIKGVFPAGAMKGAVSPKTTTKVFLPDSAIVDDGDVSNTENGFVSPSYQGTILKGRPQPSGPPGLARASVYGRSPSPEDDHSPMVTSRDFPSIPKSDALFAQQTRQAQRKHIPFPHRDAPSPPLSSSGATKSSTSASSLLDDPLTARPFVHASSAPQACFTKAARTRLHSLLHDERRPTAHAHAPLSVPSSPVQRAVRGGIVPSSLELPSIVTNYDDDETPRPSPTSERAPTSASPSIPWIHSFN